MTDISTIQIVKDFWDYGNIIITAMLGIISLVLVYKCSALLSDKIKKREKEFNALNYLTICTNRYLKYILSLWNIVQIKKRYLRLYLENTNDRSNFFKAFQIIRPPVPNFEIFLPDYAFTVKDMPILVDSLLNYTEKYAEVMGSIDFFNRDTDIVLHNNPPLEHIVSLAKSYLAESVEESNLFRWEVAICFTIYELNHLLELIHSYQIKNKYKGHVWIDIQGYQLQKIKEAEQFIDKYCPDTNWRYSLIDPNDNAIKKNKLKTFLQWIFSIKNVDYHKVIRIFGIKISIKKHKTEVEQIIADTYNLNQSQILHLNYILNLLQSLNNASYNIWNRIEEFLKEIKMQTDKQDKNPEDTNV